MDIPTLLTDTYAQAPTTVLAVAAVSLVILLVIVARLLRKLGRRNAATRVTGFATALGLGWSAQGMWDTAVHRYDQGIAVASILFVVFEAWLLGRMLRAYQYRADPARRRKFVTAVWVGASVMAVVVATGEGWVQAPGRLAIPLLVAYGWYTDLIADDDPATVVPTSWRWTPRRLLLAIGALEPGQRDAETIDADRHVIRMRNLAFRIEEGSATLNDLFRRKIRLAKLELAADASMIERARTDLARRGAVLRAEAEPTAPAPAALPSVPSAPRRRPERPPQGVHEIDGQTLRGRALREDGIARLLASVSTDLPRGMPTDQFARLYTPPLGTRTAADIAADARKRINGHALTSEES